MIERLSIGFLEKIGARERFFRTYSCVLITKTLLQFDNFLKTEKRVELKRG